MKLWTTYQEANKDRFLNELLDLLRIPSVSAKSEHNTDMITCAEAVETSLKEAQTNYLSALYDAYMAGITYKKAMGSLIP